MAPPSPQNPGGGNRYRRVGWPPLPPRIRGELLPAAAGRSEPRRLAGKQWDARHSNHGQPDPHGAGVRVERERPPSASGACQAQGLQAAGWQSVILSEAKDLCRQSGVCEPVFWGPAKGSLSVAYGAQALVAIEAAGGLFVAGAVAKSTGQCTLSCRQRSFAALRMTRYDSLWRALRWLRVLHLLPRGCPGAPAMVWPGAGAIGALRSLRSPRPVVC